MTNQSATLKNHANGNLLGVEIIRLGSKRFGVLALDYSTTKAGVPIEVVSKRLGHSSIGITMDNYMHVYQSQERQAAEAFEKLITG
jgi:integrase